MKPLLFLILTAQLQAHAVYRCERVLGPLETMASPTFAVEISSSGAREALFEAHHDLIKNGHLKASADLLKQGSRKGFTQITPEQIRTLKVTRKKAATLRSVLQIFSKKHELPEDFGAFVRDLGKINDLLAAEKFDEAQPLAKKVLQEEKQVDFDGLLKQTTLASPKSTLKYLEEIKNEAAGIMKNKKVTIEEFHEVRKILKEFLYFYQIKAQSSVDAAADPSVQQSVIYLFDLNEQLGELNDDLTAEVLNGQANKNKTKIRFPEDARKLILHFLENSHIEIDEAS